MIIAGAAIETANESAEARRAYEQLLGDVTRYTQRDPHVDTATWDHAMATEARTEFALLIAAAAADHRPQLDQWLGAFRIAQSEYDRTQAILRARPAMARRTEVTA